nr:immunoglobulin light chain junction region [Macaca mulatta]
DYYFMIWLNNAVLF